MVGVVGVVGVYFSISSNSFILSENVDKCSSGCCEVECGSKVVSVVVKLCEVESGSEVVWLRRCGRSCRSCYGRNC